jgi:uncharacterized membrane protein
MTVVRRTILCSAPRPTVEALWYDVDRWAAWVDGFDAVVQRDEAWPRAGGRLVWQSTPHGRGRVVEQVSEQRAGGGQTALVDDEHLRGTQSVRFDDHGADTQVTLELDYRLRRSWPGAFVIDLLFIRRALGESLGRTLEGLRQQLAPRTDPGPGRRWAPTR